MHRPKTRWRHSISTRLGLIVTVPTFLLIGVAGYGVWSQWRVVSDATATSRNVDLTLATQQLVHSLQKERGLSNGLLGGERQYRPAVEKQRITTDDARGELDTVIRKPGTPGASDVRTALRALADLSATRAAVDRGRAVRADTLAFYTSAIDALNTAPFAPGVGQQSAKLRNGLDALHAIGDGKEATALERGFLNGVFAAGSFKNDEYAQFTEARARKLVNLARFTQVATPEETTALKSAQRTTAAQHAAELEAKALTGAGGRQLNVDPTHWWDAMTVLVDDLREVQRTVGENLTGEAGQLSSTAWTWLITYVALAVATIVGAILLIVLAARTIARPLRRLTADAHDIAQRRLPDAVELARTGTAEDADEPPNPLAERPDELGEVAFALDHVQRTAVQLAAEQAALRHNTAQTIANLGRRNQNLLRRQLGFISTLEKQEQEPTALANLFELDHLATRMRRNAESLLVLVDESSPRRWAEPIPIADVLRSAFAEVESYRRITMRHIDDVHLRGGAVVDVSHLLAELVENALNFSPPDQFVEVRTRRTRGGCQIAVIDSGIGMTPEELATANAGLRGDQTFLAEPTKFLGHCVVGKLAKRHGIEVSLHESPLAGVTARVFLPAELLAPAAAANEPALVATTRNGLPKRAARTASPARTPTAPRPPRRQEPAVERPLTDVRTLLNDFRGGVRRGEQAGGRHAVNNGKTYEELGR